jgi:hypothetical protein
MQSARSTSSSTVAAASQHKVGVTAGAIAALVVLVAAGFGVYSMLHRAGAAPFQNFTITQVTNSDKAVMAAISPDGKYVLSVLNDKGLQSLWLRSFLSQPGVLARRQLSIFSQSGRRARNHVLPLSRAGARRHTANHRPRY